MYGRVARAPAPDLLGRVSPPSFDARAAPCRTHPLGPASGSGTALVHIAAFAPDKGESVNTLIADPPTRRGRRAHQEGRSRG